MSMVRVLTLQNGKQVPHDVDFDLLKGQTISKVLTLTEVTNGYVVLTVPPTVEGSATLMWQGLGQFYGLDFNVSIVDMRLNFLPRLLAVLQAGDEITLKYN